MSVLKSRVPCSYVPPYIVGGLHSSAPCILQRQGGGGCSPARCRRRRRGNNPGKAVHVIGMFLNALCPLHRDMSLLSCITKCSCCMDVGTVLGHVPLLGVYGAPCTPRPAVCVYGAPCTPRPAVRGVLCAEVIGGWYLKYAALCDGCTRQPVHLTWSWSGIAGGPSTAAHRSPAWACSGGAAAAGGGCRQGGGRQGRCGGNGKSARN